ncbi:MAG: cupin domain-containing protein [Archangium sp.]
MKPVNHPPSERLLAFATGAADIPLRLLVETHLSFCAGCAREVGRLGAPGGTLLEAMPEAPVPVDLFGRIWAESSRYEPPKPVAGLPLPPALLAELPPPARWHWRSVLSGGTRVARLLRDEVDGSLLYVMHMPPGARFPRHLHQGDEESLVVAGGVWDRGRFLEAGDWSSAPVGSAHETLADPKEGCWALAREERRDVRLSGWRGVLQRATSLWAH